MGVIIRSSVEQAKLAELLSPAYRKLVPPGAAFGLCTVILFPQDKKSVIYGGAAKRALRKLVVPAGETLIVIGGAFTAEAGSVLTAANALIIALSDFHWTANSYTQVRQR